MTGVLIEARKQAELALEQAEEAERAAWRQVENAAQDGRPAGAAGPGAKDPGGSRPGSGQAGLEQARKGAREEDLRAAEAGVKQGPGS